MTLNNKKKLISMDLDGVLNNYNGNYKKHMIPTIKKGAYKFLKKLSENYYIEIFTVRDKEITKNWLADNNLLKFIVGISNHKNPLASVILDDRAVNFDGNFDKAFETIATFNPYWKN